jgi:DNA-binding SARP family transcriptional activator
MSIDEKVRKTLAELGVSDPSSIEALFAEVRAAMEKERQELIARAPANERERSRICKAYATAGSHARTESCLSSTRTGSRAQLRT